MTDRMRLQTFGAHDRYCGIGHPDDRMRSCVRKPGHGGEHRTMTGVWFSVDEQHDNHNAKRDDENDD